LWGWCPSTTPREDMGPEMFLMSNRTDYECDDKNINRAQIIAQAGKFSGEFIGYPGGPCGFVK